jgi:hypothetical protein
MHARFATFTVLLGVTACSGNDDTDYQDLSSDRLPDEDDDDDDVDTNAPDSTAFDDGVFDILYLQVDATFGWDNENGRIVSVVTDYGEIPPAIAISIGDQRWGRDDFSSESEGYCLIVLPLTDPSPAGWALGEPSLYLGFDYRMSDPLLTDCGTEGYEYDENLWGRNLPETWASYGWGVAIGSLRPDYYTNFATSILLPHLVGAQIQNGLILTPGNEGIVGYVAVASEIDAAYNLVVEPDGRQPLLPAEAIDVPPGGMASALYRILPLYIFTFSTTP